MFDDSGEFCKNRVDTSRTGGGAAPGEAPPPPALPGAPEIPPVPPSARREALAAFSVENINRWLESGTIFQIRGALAFLNMRAMGGAKIDEFRGHIRRMGFSEEVGRLAGEGLAGDVMLFRRPSE